MAAILSFAPQLDMVGRLGWLPFCRSPLLYTSDGIRKALWKVRRHHRLLAPPTLRLSFAAKPSLTTKHVVMMPTTQFSRPTLHSLIAMLQWEARVGKRKSSLAIERKTEKAKRMPRVQARSAALPYVFFAASQSRSAPPGNLDAHSIAIREPPAAVVSTRPGGADGGSAKRRADQHHRALVSERAASAYAVTKNPLL